MSHRHILATTAAVTLAASMGLTAAPAASAAPNYGSTSCSTAKGHLRASTRWAKAGGVVLHDITATRAANYKPRGQWLTYKYKLHAVTAYRTNGTAHRPTVWFSNGKWHTYTHLREPLNIRTVWVADKPLTAGYQPQYVSCTLKVR